MNKWLAFASVALLSGCSADESIVGDYVIFDGGGSNQTLIGASGMISIANVTSFRLEKPYIYIEADGRFDNQLNSWQPCSYYRIDTVQNTMRRATPGSADFRQFASKIKDGGLTIMQRSCVTRDLRKHAALSQPHRKAA